MLNSSISCLLCSEYAKCMDSGLFLFFIVYYFNEYICIYIFSVSVLSDVFFSSHGLFSTFFFVGLQTFFTFFSMLNRMKCALAFAEYFLFYKSLKFSGIQLSDLGKV